MLGLSSMLLVSGVHATASVRVDPGQVQINSQHSTNFVKSISINRERAAPCPDCVVNVTPVTIVEQAPPPPSPPAPQPVACPSAPPCPPPPVCPPQTICPPPPPCPPAPQCPPPPPVPDCPPQTVCPPPPPVPDCPPQTVCPPPSPAPKCPKAKPCPPPPPSVAREPKFDGERSYFRWYAGARFVQNFTFFKERHDAGTGCATCSATDHTGGYQLGASGFIGHILTPNWSVEMEIGHLFEYSHRNCSHGGCYTIGLATPFAVASAVYNTNARDWGWLYFGAGIGVAAPELSVKDFPDGTRSNTNLSLMPSVMAGYRTRISDAWFFDFGYRLGLFNVDEMRHNAEVAGNMETFSNKIGWVMNHSISLGLVYAF